MASPASRRAGFGHAADSLYGLFSASAPAGIRFSLLPILGWPWWRDEHSTLLGGLPRIANKRFIIWMAPGLMIDFFCGSGTASWPRRRRLRQCP